MKLAIGVGYVTGTQIVKHTHQAHIATPRLTINYANPILAQSCVG